MSARCPAPGFGISMQNEHGTSLTSTQASKNLQSQIRNYTSFAICTVVGLKLGLKHTILLAKLAQSAKFSPSPHDANNGSQNL